MPLVPDQRQINEQVQNIFRTTIGRDPDAASREWWNANAGKMLSEGGPEALHAHMRGAGYADAINHPDRPGAADQLAFMKRKDQIPYANNLDWAKRKEWADYRSAAAAQQSGMNNMPGVMSDFGALNGMDREAADAYMYPTGRQAYENIQKTNKLWDLIGGLGTVSDTDPEFDEEGNITDVDPTKVEEIELRSIGGGYDR
jgi:hypothetical protein